MQPLRLVRLLIPTLVLASFLAACGGARSSATGSGSGAAVAEPAAMATAAPAAEAPAGGVALEEAQRQPGDTQAQQPAQQRLVIKNASVALEVENVTAAEGQIRASAEQLGGYIVSVQTSGSDEYLSSIVTFRVPAASFEQALAGVEGLARKVLSRSVSGDDVTEEFVDLESRLRNLDATRTRLLDLLNRATRVEDALQVNQALTDVQGQIEQIQGRMNYLQQSAAFSTITANLQPVPPAPTIIEPDGWQPVRVAQEALADLVLFAQVLARIGIVLLVWTPVWLPLVLLIRWAVRRSTATERKPKAPAA
jgi:hypothetical protein